MVRSDVKKGSARRRVDFTDVTESPRCVLSLSYPSSPPPPPPPDDNDDSKDYYSKKADFPEEGGWSPSFLGEDDNRDRDYEDGGDDGAMIFRRYKLDSRDDEAQGYCYCPLTTTVPALPLWIEEKREGIPSVKRASPVYDSESESEDWREDGEESSDSAAPPPCKRPRLSFFLPERFWGRQSDITAPSAARTTLLRTSEEGMTTTTTGRLLSAGAV